MRKLAFLLATILSVIVSSLTSPAQQPQTQTATSSTNAQWANGVAPGYWPTSGSGLTLDLSGGTALCLGTVEQYSTGALTMTASTTNYVYLNSSASCAPAVKTSAFVAGDLPIAVVTTSASAITSITDVRTWFSNSVASLANTTICNTGTAPTGTPGVAEPIDGISMTGQGNCISQLVAPDATGFFANLLNGIYDQFLYNPLSYNNGNVTGYGLQAGIGLYNSLGDCTINNSLSYTGLSGANSVFFKPCRITIASSYQFFNDGGYYTNDSSPGSGGTYFDGLNPMVVPPSVYDPQIGTFARYFHNTLAMQSGDTSNITYNNPGVCPFPLYEIAAGGAASTYANCNAIATPPSQETFNFTSPPYSGSGVPPSFDGRALTLNIYEGGHNENAAAGTRSISNVVPDLVNINRHTNAQVSSIRSVTANLGGGGDVFVNNLSVQTGGISSGNDQGVGMIIGGLGTELAPATVSISNNTPSHFGFVVPTSSVAAHAAVQRFGNSSGSTLASGVNNFLIDMGKTGSWTAGNAYSVGTSITDNHGNVQTVATAGTSGATIPTWSTTANTVDGSVVWVESVGPQGGYTKGNVVNVGENSSISEYPLTGDSAANWQTLFGSSGNTTWYITEPLPTITQSQFALGATPYTGSSTTAAYWGCQTGTPSYNSAPVVGANSVQPYPLAAFCYQISSGTPPAVGSYVQVTSLVCSETAQVLYSDSTHMVATASCDHDYGSTKSVIYQGPGVGLGFGFKADTTPSTVTGVSTIQQIRPISQVDNSGHVYIWTTPNGSSSLTGGSSNAYQGNAYLCTVTEAFTGTNGSSGSSCTVDSQPNDIQPAISAISSANYSGTSLISLTISGAGGAYQPGHQLGGIPVTFAGGICTTYPTAHFVSTYNATGNYSYASSIAIDTPGSCSSFAGMTASGPVSTPNPYYIAPISQVTDILSLFSATAGSGYYYPNQNTNGYGSYIGGAEFGGTEAQPNPYSCPATVASTAGSTCTTSVYSSSSFTGNSLAFAVGDYIDQPPPYFQFVTDNSQFGLSQWGISAGNRTVWGENINGTPPLFAARVNITEPWYMQQVLSSALQPQGVMTTQYCLLQWKPSLAYTLWTSQIATPLSEIVVKISGTAYIERVTTGGTSGTTVPVWTLTTTTDGTVTWTNEGAPGSSITSCPAGVSAPGTLTAGEGGTVTVSSSPLTPTGAAYSVGGEANTWFGNIEYPPATYRGSALYGEGSMLGGTCADPALDAGVTHPCANGIYDPFWAVKFNVSNQGSSGGNEYGMEFDPMNGKQNLVVDGYKLISLYGPYTSTQTTPAYTDTAYVNGNLIISGTCTGCGSVAPGSNNDVLINSSGAIGATTALTVNGSTITAVGTTNINATGTSTTNIGNSSSTTDVNGVVYINQNGSNNTAINSGSNSGYIILGNASSPLIASPWYTNWNGSITFGQSTTTGLTLASNAYMQIAAAATATSGHPYYGSVASYFLASVYGTSACSPQTLEYFLPTSTTAWDFQFAAPSKTACSASGIASAVVTFDTASFADGTYVAHLLSKADQIAVAIAAGSGAGTSPTVSLTGATDLKGTINVSTGTSPAASSVIATITFGTPYQSGPTCTVTPASATAVGTFYSPSAGTSSFTIKSLATALTASTAYIYSYICAN